MEIKESRILITGASRGIGLAVAEMLAAEKAHLILCSREMPKELKERLLALGALSVELVNVNLEKKDEIDSLIQNFSGQEPDMLINNAGLLTGGLLEKQSIEQIYAMVQVNLTALIHLTHGFLPGFLERKKGKIINNASVTGMMSFPAATTYAAAKAAVIAFTHSLRLELKGTGVSTLLLITPGVKTRMFDQIDDFYGAHVNLPIHSMPASKYAQIVKEAILEDLEEYRPTGITGLGLSVARHAPFLFDRFVGQRFKR